MSSDPSDYFSRAARLLRRAGRLSGLNKLSGGLKKQASTNLTTQNAGLQAVAMARDILDGYRFPSQPKLSYSGVRNARVAANSSALEDGVVTIHADFRTHTGVLVGLDIPMEIRAGELQEPSIIIHNGAPRIIAQSTFDDLTTGHTFYEEPEPRAMYSAPFSKETNKAVNENRMKIERVNTGMFSIHSSKEALRAAIRGTAINAEWDKPWEEKSEDDEATKTENTKPVGDETKAIGNKEAQKMFYSDDMIPSGSGTGGSGNPCIKPNLYISALIINKAS